MLIRYPPAMKKTNIKNTKAIQMAKFERLFNQKK